MIAWQLVAGLGFVGAGLCVFGMLAQLLPEDGWLAFPLIGMGGACVVAQVALTMTVKPSYIIKLGFLI